MNLIRFVKNSMGSFSEILQSSRVLFDIWILFAEQVDIKSSLTTPNFSPKMFLAFEYYIQIGSRMITRGRSLENSLLTIRRTNPSAMDFTRGWSLKY